MRRELHVGTGRTCQVVRPFLDNKYFQYSNFSNLLECPQRARKNRKNDKKGKKCVFGARALIGGRAREKHAIFLGIFQNKKC